MTEQPVVTLADVARMAGWSDDALLVKIAAGRIPAPDFKIGRNHFYFRASVPKVIEALGRNPGRGRPRKAS